MSLREVDSLLFFYVNRGLESPVFDLSMPFITTKYYLIVLCVACWLLIKHRKNAIVPILLAVISVALSDWLSHVLKHVIERPRPCQVYTAARLLVGCTESFSMPSNHAVNAFAMAMALSYRAGSRIRWLLISIALLVGFSRVYVGVHYPSDVIAGSFLGICVSLLVVGLYPMTLKRYETMPYSTLFLVSILGISLFRIYYITSGVVDLSPDEAHYWEWSRRLDLSYYSKGPMIAYLIAFATAIFGDNVFGIRIMAVIFSALSSVIIYLLGKELFNERTGAASGILMLIIPLYSAYGVLFTIDSPFIFFWVLSLYLFYRATSKGCGIRDSGLVKDFKTNPQPQIPYYWLLLGLSIGLGLLTKYTMAFFYVCALLFLLASKQHRGLLTCKGPYLSLILSLFLFSPVIFWNANHGWLTFRHTAGQVHIDEGFRISFKSFIEFAGSQVGVITPVIFILLIYSLFRLRKERSGNFLFWFSVPLLLFFLGKSIQAKVQANWAMPAYATGFIAFSALFVSRWEELKKWVKLTVIAGMIISMTATAFAHYSPLFGLPSKLDPSSRIRGWKELGHEVSRISGELSMNYFIFSDRYQVSSELAFYVKGKPVTYCINLGRRMNQYDLWPGFGDNLHFNAIFVTIDDIQMPEIFAKGFERCDKRIFNTYTKDEKLRDYSIFTCYDFKGLKQKEITSY